MKLEDIQKKLRKNMDATFEAKNGGVFRNTYAWGGEDESESFGEDITFSYKGVKLRRFSSDNSKYLYFGFTYIDWVTDPAADFTGIRNAFNALSDIIGVNEVKDAKA